MNSIISEQQGHSSITNANTTNSTDKVFTQSHNTCVSPVYSLPDEDRTFFIQDSVADERNDINVSAKDIETIDLCDDDTLTSFQINVEAISNLSIKENVDPAVCCSQSLLDNYQMNDTGAMKGTVYITDKQISNNVDASFWSINTIQLGHSTGQSTVEDSVSKIKFTKKETNTFGTEKITTSGNNTAHTAKDAKLPLSKSSLNLTGQNKKISIQNSINKGEKNKQIKTNKCNRKRKPKDNNQNNNKTVVKDKLGKEKTVTKKTINETIKICKETNVTLRSNGRNINKSGKVTTPVQTSTMSNSISKIYNKYIENDLSWMENIRYVREIATDEFDPKLEEFDENFWNSYSLPKNWDDQDFDA